MANVEKLQGVLDWAWNEHLKAERGQLSEWHQNTWLRPTKIWIDNEHAGRRETRERLLTELNEGVANGTACGTACCIAGRVAFDEGWRLARANTLGYYSDGWVMRGEQKAFADEIAREVLELDDVEADALFDGCNTIFDLFWVADRITNGAIVAPPEVDEHVPTARELAQRASVFGGGDDYDPFPEED